MIRDGCDQLARTFQSGDTFHGTPRVSPLICLVIVALSRETVDQREVENALAWFDSVRDTQAPRE
jgi:hypothetical protein